jgi:hypothetical protein
MKQIKLTKGYIALVDDDKYDEIVAGRKWQAQETWRKGLLYAVYAIRTVGPKSNRTTQHMHRLILGVADPKIKVDHKDGDGLNNTRDNLRIATHVTNGQNRQKRQPSIGTTFKGIRWRSDQKRWRAIITVSKKTINLGQFKTEAEAVEAYDRAALHYFGEFAKLNLPENNNGKRNDEIQSNQ